MARNRKYRTAAARFGPAIKAFILCLLIGGSGVGYVWQKNQIAELGKQIKERETKLRGLDAQSQKLKKQMADMTTVTFLQGKIRDMNLGLAAPTQTQIWYLTERPHDLARPRSEPQYALQAGK